MRDRAPARILSDATALRAFLAWYLGFDPSEVQFEFLAGGVSSAVVRVTTGQDCFVIKQALPQLRVEAVWRSRPERSGVEARCAQILGRLVPGSVPEILRVVPEAYAIVMACAPAGSVAWKTSLMRGEVDVATAQAAGRLLGRIHATAAVDPSLAADFADRSFLCELRVEPYLHHAAARHPAPAPQLLALGRKLDEPGLCLVHGDYSPKNILVTPEGALLLLDHEVAHWGQPAFDVAFVLSHLCLKAVHFGVSGRHLDAALALLDGYRASAAAVGSAASGPLCGALLAGLMLARVDGKSPVEYLTEDERTLVRGLAARTLRDPTATPQMVLAAAREVIVGG